jgi:hypothetical protein
MMRMSLSLVVASIFISACAGENGHPPVGQAYPEQGEQRASIVAATSGASDPAAAAKPAGAPDEEQGAGEAAGSGAGEAAAPVCEKESMHLLGSCIADTDGLRLQDGAHCVEHWDGDPKASATDLQYACECAKANWVAQPCSKLVDSDYCAIESTVGCSRSVVCYPKTQ